MVGIYKITNPVGKVYIGQSWLLDKRRYKYSTLRCKGQTKLYNSLKYYGWTSHLFEVVHQLPSDVNQQSLNDYETLYWQQYKELGFEMLNMREPGSNGKFSEESKRKMSDSQKGKIVSEESKLKMSIAAKERATKETWKSISEGRLGLPNPYWKRGTKHSEEAKKKIAEARKGKKQSKETRDRIVAAKKANGTLKHTEEAKQKMREAKRKS